MQHTTQASDSNEPIIIETDIQTLKTLKLRTGRKYTIKLTTNMFVTQLEINPDNRETKDDKYILSSTDEHQSYKQTLTPLDDRLTTDTCITLHYDRLVKDLCYSLAVDPGAQGEIYPLFENMPYAELVQE